MSTTAPSSAASAAAGLAGVALTAVGELSSPWDLGNAIAVAQMGVVILAVAAVPVLVALRRPALRRPILVALAVLAPVSLVAFWLAAGWILGIGGVTVARAHGVMGGDDRPADVLRLDRACVLLCTFAAATWALVYLTVLIGDLF